MTDRLHLCFGVHNHQPVGNFESVMEEAARHAYRPFLEVVRRRPALRVSVHTTGSLLEWMRARARGTFDLLGDAVASGQVELLTGGFYEPILAILPDDDKIGQIARLSDFLKTQFGVRPRGMWLAERVWEPQLPRALREAGVEFVLLDDSHFALAGLDPEAIGGYYLTEEQGSVLAVFPISQRLRYLTPFADVEESVAYLERRRGSVDVLTVADDGEKFGAWPGTHDHVYRDGWLDRFFDRLLSLPWLTATTFSDVLDRMPATDRVYLPTASYREMGEWALSVEAGRDLAGAKQVLASAPDGERLTSLLRGAPWRSFLVKYPEVADTYWKMLRLSSALRQEGIRRPDDARLREAREALWRGQANDAYWHGVFGGCYLPHLRRAVKSSLLECERTLGEVSGETRGWLRRDANGDGREEIVIRTPELAVTLDPSRGGTLTELAWLPRALDVTDVLARRPELYHDRLRLADAPGGSAEDRPGPGWAPSHEGAVQIEYDEFRRASLIDGWFENPGELGALAPWAHASAVLGRVPLAATVAPAPPEVGAADGEPIVARMEGRLGPLHVEKTVRADRNRLAARYRVRRLDGGALSGRWATQLNLALTAGSAPDRFLDLPERPALATTGGVRGGRGIALVDEWARVRIELSWSPAADLTWAPVETVSVSESGFERIYQGTAVLIAWPVDGADVCDLGVAITIGPPS